MERRESVKVQKFISVDIKLQHHPVYDHFVVILQAVHGYWQLNNRVC
jgi:hypothetical protein